MKSFKQHLNDLEKQRKSIGYFPNVVHGSHANSKKINEETEDSHYEALENYGKDNPSHTELRQHHSYLSEHSDVNHVTAYSNGSKVLNKALIDGKELSDHHKERVSGIDRALQDAPPLNRDITVFSGLGFDPRKHMDENNIITNRAYTSTSTKGPIAYGFAAHLDDDGKPTGGMGGKTVNTHTLKIDLPKGSSHGAYVDHVSMHPGENEFLLKKGIKIKIDRTEARKEELNGAEVVHHTHHGQIVSE
jgi:hypothetical protein